VYTNYYEFNKNEAITFQRLLDKKDKITASEFSKEYEKITDKEYKDIEDIDDKNVKKELAHINEIIDVCKNAGISNIEFDQNIVRGFDYYTGVVFEVFDTDPENNRALFGGGRYENLINLFETVKDDVNISGIGFGIGDVPMRIFLESRDLLPEFINSTDILLGIISDDQKVVDYANSVASDLRDDGKNVSINYDNKKVGDIMKIAEKNNIKNVVVIGEKETEDGKYEIKTT
jgi:histidyl-tRNA synthetase